MSSSGRAVQSVTTPFSITGSPAVLNMSDRSITKFADPGRFVFNGGVQFGGDISHNGTNIGFFGPGISSQQASVTAPAGTASTNVTPFGYSTAAQADAIVANIISIRNALRAYGLLS